VSTWRLLAQPEEHVSESTDGDLFHLTSKLPGEFSTLCKTSSTQWMALRYQAAGWVDNGSLTTIGDIAIPNHLVGLALLAESKAFEQNKLIRGETIVQLTDLDILWSDTGFLHGDLSGLLGHTEANQVHSALGVERRIVRSQRLASHEDSLALELWFPGEEGL
jgi:hypothetical protein